MNFYIMVFCDKSEVVWMYVVRLYYNAIPKKQKEICELLIIKENLISNKLNTLISYN